MITVTKEILWVMGHRLVDGYVGHCTQVHGHQYKAEATFEAPEKNEHGMIVDFGIIKKVCKGWIDEYLDHGFMVCERDRAMKKFLEDEHQKHMTVPFNPTVEEMIEMIASNLQHEMDSAARQMKDQPRLTLNHLRIYETPASWADWTL